MCLLAVETVLDNSSCSQGNSSADFLGTFDSQLKCRCGQQLDEVFLGTQDPLELLFPGGDSGDSEASYSEASAQFCNQLVYSAILAALESEMGFSYILEVGAGTGATTATILPLLAPDQVEYWFTDISEAFLSRAQRRWGEQYPFVKYELYDAQKHPIEQGIAVHRFDIVIAVNVLHATGDLSITLTNINQMLRSGGILLLSEYTLVEQTALADATFGLTEGWWLFDDGRNYVLQSREQWSTWFNAYGFEMVCASHHSVMEWQTVFVARALLSHAIGRVPKRLHAWNGACFMTGGLGGVGLMTAMWLIGSGVTELHLLSRSGKTNSLQDSTMLQSVQDSRINVLVIECDVMKQGLLRALQTSKIEGIVHSAGVLADGMIQNQTISSFYAVSSTKVAAAESMHRLFSNQALRYLVAYSSMAGVFGSPGQSPHCMANAALDSFVQYRRAQGLAALSVQWGTWSSVGYAARVGADIRTNAAGVLQSLSPSVGIRLLCSIWSTSSSAVLITPIIGDVTSLFPGTAQLVSGIASMIRRDRERHTIERGNDRPQLSTSLPDHSVPTESIDHEAARQDMLALVAGAVNESTGLWLAADEPLGEGGVDSLASIQVRSFLRVAFEGISIPATAISNESCIRDIAHTLYEQVHFTCPATVHQIPASVEQGPPAIKDTHGVVITGSACRTGGGVHNKHTFWTTCCEKTSLVTREPPPRWQGMVDTNPACSHHALSAAFIQNVDSFDAAFFRLPSVRADGMDPTERLLLEVAVESIYDAGYTLISDILRETSIITCVSTSDFTSHGAQDILTPRTLAQILGMHAHFENCNTICSSSHVAVHRACDLLGNEKCKATLIGSAMLLLNPKTSVGTDKMGILSPSGIARPFDRNADGLVRGEGIGCIVLESATMQSVRAFSGLLTGSSVNTDNLAVQLGVPDQDAEEMVIKGALLDSGVEATRVNYTEMHGMCVFVMLWGLGVCS